MMFILWVKIQERTKKRPFEFSGESKRRSVQRRSKGEIKGIGDDKNNWEGKAKG